MYLLPDSLSPSWQFKRAVYIAEQARNLPLRAGSFRRLDQTQLRTWPFSFISHADSVFIQKKRPGGRKDVTFRIQAETTLRSDGVVYSGQWCLNALSSWRISDTWLERDNHFPMTHGSIYASVPPPGSKHARGPPLEAD